MAKLEIHNRLKEARKVLNLNQLVIATDLGIQQKTISEIENGRIQNIPNTYIYYFYKKGISLDWIYESKEPMMLADSTLTSETEKKAGNFNIDSIFEILPQRDQDIQKEENTKEEEGDIDKITTLFERLIDSKDLNIKSLMAYIQSLENNLSYIKDLLTQKK